MGKHHYKSTLEIISVSKIMPNPNNPRGKSIRSKDNQFLYLKKSIQEYGLLVPLVVKKEDKNTYLLLDGERRYYAVKELGIKEVPAHVFEGTISFEQCKSLMFHIHTTRVQWGAYQQCISLEPLYIELKKITNDDEEEIIRQINERTRTSKRTIDARLNFLRWPVELKEIVKNKKPGLFTSVVEIENQIIKPLQKSYNTFVQTYGADEIRKAIFNKYYNGYINSAIEARKLTPLIKVLEEDVKYQIVFAKIFKKFLNDEAYTIHKLEKEFRIEFPNYDSDASITFDNIYGGLKQSYNIITLYEPKSFCDLNKRQKIALKKILTRTKKVVTTIEKNIGVVK